MVSPTRACAPTPAIPLLMALLALAVLVPQERLPVIQKHIVHGRERVVYHLYLVDVPVYALMPFAFLRQGTSPSPQRGGLCEAHRIIVFNLFEWIRGRPVGAACSRAYYV